MLMIARETINKLRVSGPLPSDAEVKEARRAYQDGIDMLAREGVSAPSPESVVWRLMKDAAQTEARMPDREKGWLLSHGRSIWPELALASEECRKVEWEISLEELAGVRLRDTNAPAPRLTITDPAAVSRWLVVQGWLRYVKARNPQRDKAIVLARARGVSAREICRMMGGRLGDRAIEMVREKVLRHIIEGLRAANLLDFASLCGKLAT